MSIWVLQLQETYIFFLFISMCKNLNSACVFFSEFGVCRSNMWCTRMYEVLFKCEMPSSSHSYCSQICPMWSMQYSTAEEKLKTTYASSQRRYWCRSNSLPLQWLQLFILIGKYLGHSLAAFFKGRWWGCSSRLLSFNFISSLLCQWRTDVKSENTCQSCSSKSSAIYMSYVWMRKDILIQACKGQSREIWSSCLYSSK